jgi:nucleoside-diphosphate-sugar epimerase
VLASTSSLYAGQPTPFEESLPVNQPISPYAASKKAAEVTAYTYHHLFGIDVSVLRYFTVYGPAGRPDMAVLRFVHGIATEQPIQLYGDGSFSRDFTYVDDIAEGTIQALQPVGYEIINLGGGNTPVSLHALIQTLEELLSKKAKVEYCESNSADMSVTWANIDKALRLLSWRPRISLREGLRKTVIWYQQNTELAQSVLDANTPA